MTAYEPIENSARTRLGAIFLIGLLALAAGGKSILFDTIDPDCFWHLRVADQLTRDGIHPLVDELSFASIKQPWTPYSWLAELGMKAIWDAGGIRAAVATEAILVAAIFTLIALAAVERSGKLLTSGVVTFLAIVLCLPYLSFRPVTASLGLLALCWWLLMRDTRMQFKSQAVWWILPLTVLNVNLHFFAALAPLWVGCTWLSTKRGGAAGKYLCLGVSTSLACLATPMLPGVIATVARYQFQDPMLGAGIISEFTPFYHGTMGAALAGILVLLLTRTFRNRHDLFRGEWVSLIVSSLLLFKMGRFAPVFAIVAIPLFSVTAPTLRDRVLGRTIVVAALGLCFALAAVKVTLALPSRAISTDQWINRHGPDVPGYPTDAAAFVAQHVQPDHHRLINEFSWGGYLAWRLGDQYQVLMDGRTQLYTPAFWRSMYLDPKDALEHTLSDVRADAAVLPASRSRLRDSLLALGWRSAFRDERAEVLLPPAAPIATIDETGK